ncbi:MAG TPA: hypothetical protein VNT79_03165 [Phycisphaerae bacterium]|nr:hypothetical protein [Phycisphaerae bacterium]
MPRGWCNEELIEPARSGSKALMRGELLGGQALQPAPPPSVQGLRPDIIPQRLFPLKKWYYANPLWYYHAPAVEHRLQTDAKFYELVDPALKDLCKLLLDAKLCTTPSCQGHFYHQSRFERIWDELQSEAHEIRDAGLLVTDSETDETRLFHQPDYALAWHNFEEFYQQAAAHQGHGFIGIAIPANRDNLIRRLSNGGLDAPALRLERDAQLEGAIGEPMFSVTVAPASAEERDAAWAAVTEYFRDLLKTERTTAVQASP